MFRPLQSSRQEGRVAGEKASGGVGRDGILNIVCRWKQEFEKRGPGGGFRFWA